MIWGSKINNPWSRGWGVGLIFFGMYGVEFSFLFLHRRHEIVKFFSGWLILYVDLFISKLVLARNVREPSITSHLRSLLPFSNFAIKVYDSHAYMHTENMEMTRECISFTFDPRDMLLSL